MMRPKGVAATAEKWHRDEAELAKPTDQLFGGWWNFDDDDQVFSCVPGTHRGVSGHSGFAPIRDAAQRAAYKASSVTVRIPPGSMLVFYERTVHEVVSRAAKHDMFRQFLGWRLTRSDEPLYPVDAKFKVQAVMPLKSNQTPPMYAKLHWTNHRSKIDEFTAQNIVPECTESRRVNSGARKGDAHTAVHEHMRSLEEYGFQLYPKYRAAEVNMHKPRTTFVVRRGSDDAVKRVKWQ